jgi:hypothetical protein
MIQQHKKLWSFDVNLILFRKIKFSNCQYNLLAMISGLRSPKSMNNSISKHTQCNPIGLESSADKGIGVYLLRWYNKLDPALDSNMEAWTHNEEVVLLSKY